MNGNIKTWKFCTMFLITAMLFNSGIVQGRTKLVTLPDRRMIRMDLKNPTDTLLEEERIINMQKGVNRIDFSWANVLIDKGSIQIRCIKSPGEVAVLNANYPPNENALFWEICSDKPGPAVFRISYIMRNITREISYQAVADHAEKNLILDYYMTLKNFSGERLMDCDIQPGYGKDFRKDLDNAESKKMLCARFPGIPVKKIYIYDPGNNNNHVRMYYRLINNEESGLGAFPLQSGKARIFQTDSEKTQAFLGEDWGAYTALGNNMDLFLGLAKDVSIKRFKYREDKVNCRGKVYDLEQEFRFEVQNFKSNSVKVILKEHPGGEWLVKSIILKEEKGERNEKQAIVIDHREMVTTDRIDTNNLDLMFSVPPTSGDLKYQLFVTLVLKNRW